MVATKSFVNTNKIGTKGVDLHNSKSMNQLEMLTLKNMNRFALFLALSIFINSLCTTSGSWTLFSPGVNLNLYKLHTTVNLSTYLAVSQPSAHTKSETCSFLHWKAFHLGNKQATTIDCENLAVEIISWSRPTMKI